MLASFGGLIMINTDTIMLTYFSGLKNVALYNVALPIAMLPQYFVRTISIVLMPMVSELWTKAHKDYLKQGVELLQKYLFVVVIPVALLIFSFPKIIIRVFFGETYVGASLALQILSIGIVLYSIGLLNISVFPGIGKPKINTKLFLISALINVIGNAILVPLYGIVGAAIATSLSFGVLTFLSILKLEKFIKVSLPLFEWIKILFTGIVFVLIITYLKKILVTGVWMELFICSTVSLVVYISLIFSFKIIKIEEIKKYMGLVKETVMVKITKT